jgi:hypothetical protein
VLGYCFEIDGVNVNCPNILQGAVDEFDECGVCNINLLRVVGLLDTAINMLMAYLLK